jgi:hypothetical protein
MSILEVLLFAALFVCLIMCGILGIRAEVVFHYRMRVLDKIHSLNTADLGSDSWWDDFDRRSSKYDAVDYNYMVLHFWRKPSSFYDPEIRV